MKTIIFGSILSLLTVLNDYGTNYQGDLILRARSDSAIRYLKPPLSLTVLQNRPEKGFYYFFSNEKPKFDENLDGNLKNKDALDNIISDTKIIKKTLRSTDPARLSPASIGADFKGAINRNRLKNLFKTNSSDILFIYRREIKIQSSKEFPDTYFQTPELFLKPATTNFSVEILTKGLVYISKQKKVLALSHNKQNVNITKGQSDIDAILERAVKSGLKKLAEEAKKKVQAQKKIITKSY